MKVFFLAAATLAAMSAVPASASVTFNLSGVTFGTGTLSGSFTTNDALTTVTDYNLTASAGTSGGFTFTSFVYTPTTSSVVSQALPSSFTIFSTGQADQLRLNFGPLTSSGATLLTSSYESQLQAGSRFVTAGRAVSAASPVPEPAAWAMMISGVGMAGFAVRRRRSVGATVKFA